MMATVSPPLSSGIQPLPLPPALLGESPLWHPAEQALYWCDIPAMRVHRFDPRSQQHVAWSFDTEPACCVPLQRGGVLLALRDGLWRLDTRSGARERVAAAPYDSASERFNDGKADAQGRFWIGTLNDRREPKAALYRWAGGSFTRMAEGITTGNGLAFSPDGRTMYWADTRAHGVVAFDVDASAGSLSRRRVFRQFAPRVQGQSLDDYGGRPDGAAVDAEGAYWVAMFEGQCLLRLSPQGELLAKIALPVRCPTMPCFGGADLRTLYITTARHNRPADELAQQPWAGCVLQCRVEVAGLPAHFAQA